MNKLIDVLVERDDISREEAIEQIREFHETMLDMMDDGCSEEEIHDEFLCVFGLESDYLIDIYMMGV